MTPRTQELHAALRDVADHEVVFHAGYTSHVQGYAWRDGGDMPAARQVAMHELASVHLIAPITACIHQEIAAEVVLTRSGTDQLAVWDIEVMRSAGRHRAGATS